MHVLVHVVRGMVKFAIISRNKCLSTRRPCIHNGARDTVLLQAFDRLQQRNEALWDAIKTKSEEKSLLDDDKDGGIKSESDIDKSGTCTCHVLVQCSLARCAFGSHRRSIQTLVFVAKCCFVVIVGSTYMLTFVCVCCLFCFDVRVGV